MCPRSVCFCLVYFSCFCCLISTRVCSSVTIRFLLCGLHSSILFLLLSCSLFVSFSRCISWFLCVCTCVGKWGAVALLDVCLFRALVHHHLHPTHNYAPPSKSQRNHFTEEAPSLRATPVFVLDAGSVRMLPFRCRDTFDEVPFLQVVTLYFVLPLPSLSLRLFSDETTAKTRRGTHAPRKDTPRERGKKVRSAQHITPPLTSMQQGMQRVMNQVMGQAQALPPPPPPPQWSTRLTQCDQPARTEDWCFACFCPQCAQSSAKSSTDRSDCIFNFCCFHPIGSYSHVRHAYGIPGSCGDDLGYGLFCMPCATRRILTEARVKGLSYGTYGANNQQWQNTLFGCTCCELLEAAICPCLVVHQTRGLLQPGSREDCCFNSFCILPTSTYGQVRHHYNLISDCPLLEDLCLPLVCFPCTLNQARREALYHQASRPLGAPQAVRPF